MNIEEINIRKQTLKQRMKIGLSMLVGAPICGLIIGFSFFYYINSNWEEGISMPLVYGFYAVVLIMNVATCVGGSLVGKARLELKKIKQELNDKSRDEGSFVQPELNFQRNVPNMII